MALVLVVLFNRRHLVRPNVFLTLVTVVAAASLATSIRLPNGVGSIAREVRLCAFIAVLWLLTPLWGRRDLLLARWHMRCLAVVCVLVTAGLVISPGAAFQIQGRLYGTIWPVPPTQVGHYAAVMAGMGVVLWMGGALRRRPAFLTGAGGLTILLLSQTRTAMFGVIAGVLCATASLFVVRRRARNVVAVVLVVVPIGLIGLAPAVNSWFTRGQSSEQISGLTGRTQVWDRLVEEPRSELRQWFGTGLSNKAFDGLPIDNSWLAIYQDQGLFGDIIVGTSLVFLLLLALFRPRPGFRGRRVPGRLLHDRLDHRDRSRRRVAVPPRPHGCGVAARAAGVDGHARNGFREHPSGAQPLPLVVTGWRGPRRRPGGGGAARTRSRRAALRASQRRHRPLGAPEEGGRRRTRSVERAGPDGTWHACCGTPGPTSYTSTTRSP